ncbi:MAG: PilZ domain-containing protein [Candidatus Xenobia bacterium]
MYIWKNIAVPAESQTFERRTVKRFKIALEVAVCRVNQGKFCKVRTQDVSSGGIRFTTTVPLAVGEVLDLSIPLEGQTPVNVVGKVAWCRAMPDSRFGTYEGGVAFTRISARSHDRLVQYLDALEAASTPQA